MRADSEGGSRRTSTNELEMEVNHDSTKFVELFPSTHRR